MSAITTIEVPLAAGSTPQIGAILSLDNSPGQIVFNIQDIMSKGVKYTQTATASGGTVRFLESADAKTWSIIGDPVVIRPGGEKSVPVVTQKKFIAVSGFSAAGGYVRVDITQRGEPFRGQVTIGNFGKRGLGKDYSGESAAAPLSTEAAPASYPE